MDAPVAEDPDLLPGERASSIVPLGILFEGSLVLVASLLSWAWGHSLWEDWADATAEQYFRSTLLGLVATVPLLVALLVSRRLPGAAWRRLRQVVDDQLLPLFVGSSWRGLLLLSMAAGLGEELLFRALLQELLADWLGGESGRWWALGVVSLLFGLCHWVTPAYGIFATLVSAYLGLLYWSSGGLVAAVVAHAAYDFVALIWLVRTVAPGGGQPRSL